MCVTWHMLVILLKMTSFNSQTCWTPGEQIIKYYFKILSRNYWYFTASLMATARLTHHQSYRCLYGTLHQVNYTVWVLNENIIQKMLVFERKILRRIFGPTKENPIWRIKTNEELDKLIKHGNIVNYIKTQRLSCLVTYTECLIPEQLRKYSNGIP